MNDVRSDICVVLQRVKYVKLAASLEPLADEIIALVDTAHSADLWARALDPATVEAVALAWMNMALSGSTRAPAQRYKEHEATAAITALLTALCGPKPESEVGND